MVRKRKRKSRTIVGERVPIELYRESLNIQKKARALGKKMSRQDAYRRIVRCYRRK